MKRKSQLLILGVLALLLFVFFSLVGSFLSSKYLQTDLTRDREETVAPFVKPTEKYLVTKVIDGDTVELNTGERVRYLAVDAPELDQQFGLASLEANRRLVLHKEVKLEYDNVIFDNYGRLLAYVWIDNILVNEKLVEEGYVRVSYIPTMEKPRYLDRLKKAEERARSFKKGLWEERN